MDIDIEDLGIDFFVPGIPAPGGSKRFVGIGRRTGRAILIDAAGAKNKNWRAVVAQIAHQYRLKELLTGPIEVTFEFVMPRPKKHYHTSKAKLGMLRDDAPYWHTTKPDVLKLARSTEDALTGILWADDSANSLLHPQKHYGNHPGCYITIERLQNPAPI